MENPKITSLDKTQTIKMNIYLLTLSLGVILGFITGKMWSNTFYKLQKMITHKTFLKNYHIHHSLGGLIISLLAVIILNNWLETIIVGLGIGMLIEHTISNGFVFLTKK
ncbi:MAG: hypothetical protein UT39_C0004G0057 [Candidatus Woesebacteria bacterium GW2011_GWA1_39_21]|uniref:Uncharacterized protein n=1 Tax=Candidatus Woesebacteria bacterium GW2011_GWA1_39_21 TaxID=1618550 RepID=A0A0G0N8D7_9BACT|nr:MAG: hypothetical protein UT39_C0004G0057 [Candidatus Woesebacteria bacterium GW2011_GWA1_39_21]